MPELPEVESVRRSLEPVLVGRQVLNVRLHRRDILVAPGDPPGGFSRQRSAARLAPRSNRHVSSSLLAGATITRLVRSGKQLAIIAQDAAGHERALGVHLGMSGHLLFLPRHARLLDLPDALARHVHATWTFEHGRLLFADPRRFGLLRAFSDLAHLQNFLSSLGPDALTLTAHALIAACSRSRRPIKAVLLDQSRLAGVGNIYADEALHLAGIHPEAPATTLAPPALERLAGTIRATLARALEHGGSSIRDYTDANGTRGSFQREHLVYGRAGLPCTGCGSILDTLRVAQRTSVICRLCQPPACQK